MILTFGKHKNEILANTPESYIRWLATHKAVLSVEHRGASDAAKAILEKRAQVTTPVATGNTNWNEWHESLHIVAKPVSNDVGLRGHLNTSKAFSLMR